MSALRTSSGTTTGSPAEGIGSSASCTAYQSGSIHTSATHSSAMAGGTPGPVAVGAGAATAAGMPPAAGSPNCSDSPPGAASPADSDSPSGSEPRGMAPVVKS